MAENLEIRVISREFVKPCLPTPAHLSRFNLSLLDQGTDDRFVPCTWFYSGYGTHPFPQKCRQLKSSLAQTLSLYYPMAGRIRDPNKHWVDCCDEGVEFVEAQMKCPMTRFLGSTDPELLKLLVPLEPEGPSMIWNRKRDESLCVVQATLFECGGMAVTCCMSHKLADGAAAYAFARAWGTIATRSGPVEPPPGVGLGQILPPLPGEEKPSMSSNVSSSSCAVVTRRFLFSAGKIEELKRGASSSVVRKATRVEAVMGLLWKCAVAASRSVKSSSTGPPRSSTACVAVNLRKGLAASSSVISDKTLGNLVGAAFATTKMGDDDDDVLLPDLVVALRKAVEVVNVRLQGGGRSSVNYTSNYYKDMISSVSFEVGAGEVMKSGEVDFDCFYIFSSGCGALPVNLDLGFGRSIWFTFVLSSKNLFVLIDLEDSDQQQQPRGVQALVTLGEKEMEFFENDKLLLTFADHDDINHYSPLKSNL